MLFRLGRCWVNANSKAGDAGLPRTLWSSAGKRENTRCFNPDSAIYGLCDLSQLLTRSNPQFSSSVKRVTTPMLQDRRTEQEYKFFLPLLPSAHLKAIRCGPPLPSLSSSQSSTPQTAGDLLTHFFGETLFYLLLTYSLQGFLFGWM